MFFIIKQIFRMYFPKKGSMSWVLKRVRDLQTTHFEIIIKDGKASINVPPGKYEETIQLMAGVDLKSHNDDDVK